MAEASSSVSNAPVPDAGEQVAAEGVGAEGVVEGGRQQPRSRVESERIAGQPDPDDDEQDGTVEEGQQPAGGRCGPVQGGQGSVA